MICTEAIKFNVEAESRKSQKSKPILLKKNPEKANFIEEESRKSQKSKPISLKMNPEKAKNQSYFY